jgi:hypothetical protein
VNDSLPLPEGTLSGFRIGWSLHCAECRYDLRGLGVAGACPECGTPLAQSLDPLRLVNAPASYVRWLARAATIQMGVIGCLLACIVAFRIAVPWLFLVVTGLVGIVSVWMMALPDPRGIEPADQVRTRKWLRGVAPLPMALLGLGWLASRVEVYIGPPFALAMLGAWVALCVFWFLRCRGLARRLPHRGLAMQAFCVMWVLAVSVCWYCIGLVVRLDEFGYGAAFFFIYSAMIAHTLGWALGLAFMLRFRRALNRARLGAEAREALDGSASHPG